MEGVVRKGHNNYIYQKCVDCGKERLVKLYKRKPVTERCLPCTQKLDSYRSNISKSNLGRKPHNLGVPHSEETKAKMRNHKRVGIPKSVETRIKISNAHKGKSLSDEHKNNLSKSHVGIIDKDRNPNWKGGVTPLRKEIRDSRQYDEWRESVYKRDNYTCQLCGMRGNILNAHHKKPFAKILEEYGITTMEDAIKCTELWDIRNGITLCKKGCHSSYKES